MKGDVIVDSTTWLVLVVVLLLIEIVTLGLTTIWFAGGALIATIASALGAPVYVQVALFIVASMALLLFTRPLAVKYFNKDRAKTNIESFIGRTAIVTSEINNIQGIGQVTVGGQEWTARSSSDNIILEIGEITTVLAIQGVKLIVEKRKEDN